ncbi:putative aldouronate transport system permease protein [Cohnella sp. OV330]|uniref:carbohydrate ABC transporter permease n=1 Tax=Cohnella sp. OV330 TaxID=1855288 RepID=UPI0008EE60EE|nr:carbohydrate ABC transporter permease [Cohnella sp. OV330]SFA92701.1 putative aldouronate transport system permease protein [Cohnella sp. OV330]
MFALKRRTRGEAVFDGVNVLLMLVICFVTIYPVWYVLVNSLNSGQDAMRGGIYWLPRVFTLDNYAAVVDNPGIVTAMGITVAKTLAGTVLHVFFTAMVAYAFSRRELIGRNLYMILGTVTMIFNGGLIPTFLLIRDLQLLDNFFVYIIPAMFSFFDLIIFVSFFRELPQGLEEAAKIDGANDLVLFLRVVIPVSLPVVATIALFHGVWQWNDYFAGVIYITQNTELQPIQTFLYRVVAQNDTSQMVTAAAGGITKSVTSNSVKMATMVVTTLPIVLAYPFLQRYFVKGLMIGSIKG